MPRLKSFAIWFRPKVIGYGFSPASWEGWLCTLVAAPLAILAVKLLADNFGN